MTTKWPGIEPSFLDQELTLDFSIFTTIAQKNFQYGFSIGGYSLEDVLIFYHPLQEKDGFYGKNTLTCPNHLQKRYLILELSMLHGSSVGITRSSNIGLNHTPFL